VPKSASVSATYLFVPHLAHRTRIYNFPEPWKRVDWGVNGEGLDNPGVVQWLVVDRRLFDAYDHNLVDALLGSQFTVRFDQQDIVVAQRTTPGGRIAVSG
jgi:hypothetical protein